MNNDQATPVVLDYIHNMIIAWERCPWCGEVRSRDIDIMCSCEYGAYMIAEHGLKPGDVL